MQKIDIPGNYQYQALSSKYLPQRFWHHNKFYLLDLLINFSDHDLILDAGCGSGNLSIYLSRRFKKIIGLDGNLQAIGFAKKRVHEEKISNVEFQQGDLTKLSFKNHSFTKIVLFEVIEHLTPAEYQKILDELYRVLKPGGQLYLTTPNKISFWPILEWLLDFFKLVPSLKEQHLLEFTPESIKDLISQNGFQLKKLGTMNHFSPLVSFFSWGLAKKIFRFEINHLHKLGPIIWLIAEKTQKKGQ